MGRAGQWMHGFLDLCLLALLSSGADYEFGIAQRLAQAGLGEVPGGTLYPALLRLEQQGWVSATWATSQTGPRRKYYALTPQGSAVLERDAAGWALFRASVDGVVGSRVHRRAEAGQP